MATGTQMALGVLVTPHINQAALNTMATNAGASFANAFNNSSNRASQPLGRITGQVQEFEKSMAAANARVLAFGASAGAIYLIKDAFSKLISSTIEVEKALTEINAVLEVGETSLSRFSAAMFKAASETGQSFQTVSKVALEFARHGVSAAETVERMTSAMQLMRISGMTAGDAVNSITAAVNAFNKEGLTSIDIVGRMAAVDTRFAVSSQDLAKAIERVGSTAVDVGIKFNQLLGLVTAVQTATARGGAVIGNAFKSIFTRMGRPEVLKDLESVGVATKDAQGRILPMIEILKRLAHQYDDLSLSQRSFITEAVGGVYQVNILKASLADLGQGFSVYDKATLAAANSTGLMEKRMAMLNETISAKLNTSAVQMTKLFSSFGKTGFGSGVKGALDTFNKQIELFASGLEEASSDASVGEKLGKSLAQGISKGLGDIVSGPGVQMAAALIAKISVGLTKFSYQSGREMMGLNDPANRQKALQQSINNFLQQNVGLVQLWARGQININTLSQIYLQNLKAANTLQAQLSNASSAMAVGAAGGVTIRSTPAAGFVPNFRVAAHEEAGAEKALARMHGYAAGPAVRKVIWDGKGGARLTTVNQKETVIEKVVGGRRGSFVIPPNGFGAGTTFAAQGHVPNFAASETEYETGAVIPRIPTMAPNPTRATQLLTPEILSTFKSGKKLMKYLADTKLHFATDGPPGSSRLFIPLNDNQGVKIAMGTAGVAQNRVEMPLLEDPEVRKKYGHLLPQSYGYDDKKFLWGIHERVNNRPTPEDFVKHTGKGKGFFLADPQYDSPVEKQIREFTAQHDVLIGDLRGGRNMGVGDVGKGQRGLKMFDIGFNRDVYEKHYRRRDMGMFASGYVPNFAAQGHNVPLIGKFYDALASGSEGIRDIDFEGNKIKPKDGRVYGGIGFSNTSIAKAHGLASAVRSENLITMLNNEMKKMGAKSGIFVPMVTKDSANSPMPINLISNEALLRQYLANHPNPEKIAKLFSKQGINLQGLLAGHSGAKMADVIGTLATQKFMTANKKNKDGSVTPPQRMWNEDVRKAMESHGLMEESGRVLVESASQIKDKSLTDFFAPEGLKVRGPEGPHVFNTAIARSIDGNFGKHLPGVHPSYPQGIMGTSGSRLSTPIRAAVPFPILDSGIEGATRPFSQRFGYNTLSIKKDEDVNILEQLGYTPDMLKKSGLLFAGGHVPNFGLYHRDLGFPPEVAEQLNRIHGSAVAINPTGHARQAVLDDIRKHGVDKLPPIPKNLTLDASEIVEVEHDSKAQGFGKTGISKLLVRRKGAKGLDQMLAILPNGTLKTVWHNSSDDNHQTLDKKKYTAFGSGFVPNFKKFSGRGISDDKILSRFRAGVSKGSYFSDFYSKYEKHNPLEGGDRELFNKIYASQSRGTDDRLVFNTALKIFKGVKSGKKDFSEELRPLGTVTGRMASMRKLLNNEPFNTEKTSAYYRALSGDPNSLAIDRNVIQTALGKTLKDGEQTTPAFRERLRKLIGGVLAPELGMEPRAIQASLFAGRSKFKPSFAHFAKGFAQLRGDDFAHLSTPEGTGQEYLGGANANALRFRTAMVAPNIDISRNAVEIAKDLSSKQPDEFKNLWRNGLLNFNAAHGFAPNFSMDAIEDALDREGTDTARVGTASELKSLSNPFGLGVYDSAYQSNLSDAFSQHRAIGETDLKNMGKTTAASGFVPNFDIGSSLILGSLQGSFNNLNGILARTAYGYNRQLETINRLNTTYVTLSQRIGAGEVVSHGGKTYDARTASGGINRRQNLVDFARDYAAANPAANVGNTQARNIHFRDYQQYRENMERNQRKISTAGTYTMMMGPMATQLGASTAKNFGKYDLSQGLEVFSEGVTMSGQLLSAFPNKLGVVLTAGTLFKSAGDAVSTFSSGLGTAQRTYDMASSRAEKMASAGSALLESYERLRNATMDASVTLEEYNALQIKHSKSLAEISALPGGRDMIQKLASTTSDKQRTAIISRAVDEGARQKATAEVNVQLAQAKKENSFWGYNFNGDNGGRFSSNSGNQQQKKNLLRGTASELMQNTIQYGDLSEGFVERFRDGALQTADVDSFVKESGKRDEILGDLTPSERGLVQSQMKSQLEKFKVPEGIDPKVWAAHNRRLIDLRIQETAARERYNRELQNTIGKGSSLANFDLINQQGNIDSKYRASSFSTFQSGQQADLTGLVTADASMAKIRGDIKAQEIRDSMQSRLDTHKNNAAGKIGKSLGVSIREFAAPNMGENNVGGVNNAISIRPERIKQIEFLAKKQRELQQNPEKMMELGQMTNRDAIAEKFLGKRSEVSGEQGQMFTPSEYDTLANKIADGIASHRDEMPEILNQTKQITEAGLDELNRNTSETAKAIKAARFQEMAGAIKGIDELSRGGARKLRREVRRDEYVMNHSRSSVRRGEAARNLLNYIPSDERDMNNPMVKKLSNTAASGSEAAFNYIYKGTSLEGFSHSKERAEARTFGNYKGVNTDIPQLTLPKLNLIPIQGSLAKAGKDIEAFGQKLLGIGTNLESLKDVISAIGKSISNAEKDIPVGNPGGGGEPGLPKASKMSQFGPTIMSALPAILWAVTALAALRRGKAPPTAPVTPPRTPSTPPSGGGGGSPVPSGSGSAATVPKGGGSSPTPSGGGGGSPVPSGSGSAATVPKGGGSSPTPSGGGGGGSPKGGPTGGGASAGATAATKVSPARELDRMANDIKKGKAKYAITDSSGKEWKIADQLKGKPIGQIKARLAEIGLTEDALTAMRNPVPSGTTVPPSVVANPMSKRQLLPTISRGAAVSKASLASRALSSLSSMNPLSGWKNASKAGKGLRLLGAAGTIYGAVQAANSFRQGDTMGGVRGVLETGLSLAGPLGLIGIATGQGLDYVQNKKYGYDQTTADAKGKGALSGQKLAFLNKNKGELKKAFLNPTDENKEYRERAMKMFGSNFMQKTAVQGEQNSYSEKYAKTQGEIAAQQLAPKGTVEKGSSVFGITGKNGMMRELFNKDKIKKGELTTPQKRALKLSGVSENATPEEKMEALTSAYNAERTMAQGRETEKRKNYSTGTLKSIEAREEADRKREASIRTYGVPVPPADGKPVAPAQQAAQAAEQAKATQAVAQPQKVNISAEPATVIVKIQDSQGKDIQTLETRLAFVEKLVNDLKGTPKPAVA